MVVISNENYVTLFKNKDIRGYVKFFSEEYPFGQMIGNKKSPMGMDAPTRMR